MFLCRRNRCSSPRVVPPRLPRRRRHQRPLCSPDEPTLALPLISSSAGRTERRRKELVADARGKSSGSTSVGARASLRSWSAPVNSPSSPANPERASGVMTMGFSRRRTMQFSAALHAMRHEPRGDFRQGAMMQRSLAAVQALTAERAARSRILATAAGYDRSAIMSVALFEARSARASGSRLPWGRLMSAALAVAWIRAKRARAAVPR
jgi:hypothetical protein